MSEDPTPDQIMQVGLGFWASKTLLGAVEMELFTELARHPEIGESAARQARPSSALVAEFSRRAGGAWLPGTPRRRVPQHAQHGPIPGQTQGLVRRPDRGDGRRRQLHFCL